MSSDDRNNEGQRWITPSDQDSAKEDTSSPQQGTEGLTTQLPQDVRPLLGAQSYNPDIILPQVGNPLGTTSEASQTTSREQNESPRYTEPLIRPLFLPVPNRLCEPRVYNKTADPPPEGETDNGSQGQSPAGLLQDTTTGNGSPDNQGEGNQIGYHQYRDDWEQFLDSDLDLTNVVINDRFEFVRDPANSLPTPAAPGVAGHRSLAPMMHEEVSSTLITTPRTVPRDLP